MTVAIDEIPAPSVLRRPDGRALAWYEFGDKGGIPCVYTPGTPASGVCGLLYDAPAKASGIRWISMDKPGYGHSDEHPKQTLVDWAADVGFVADHLGFARFAVAGESGGGPHALAAGFALRDRVTCVAVIAGVSVGGSWTDPDPGKLKTANQEMFRLLRDDPAGAVAVLTSLKAAVDDPDAGAALVTAMFAEAPPYDREVIARPGMAALMAAATAGAFRNGVSATIDEFRMFVEPWGFDLARVSVPVHLWHGTADMNVSIDTARAIAGTLPDPTFRVIDGAGHLIGPQVADEVMAVIAAQR